MEEIHNKYGFLHTFRPDQIIFLRGDFIHAGVPSRVPSLGGTLNSFHIQRLVGQGKVYLFDLICDET